MFHQAERKELAARAANFIAKHPAHSNYFGTNAPVGEYLEEPDVFLLRVPESGHFRLYAIAQSLDSLEPRLKALPPVPHVMNFPGRSLPEGWAELMSRCGFNRIGVYERMANPHPQRRGTFPVEFAGIRDFEPARKLIDDNFSPYTDYPPDDNLLREMLEQNRVLAGRTDGKLTGLLAFTPQTPRYYLNLWVDHFGGPKLVFDIYNHLCDRGAKALFLWVNSENEKVRRIHERFGAKADGMKDYSFLRG